MESSRQFVVVFYLADDTVAIFEPTIRNSGLSGGKFLQRSLYKHESGRIFLWSDFYEGARFVINGFTFTLGAPDQRTVQILSELASVDETGSVGSFRPGDSF